MIITKIISSGASGAESAALDVATRLKIPYGGYALEGSMLGHARIFRRYKLWEKPFPRTEDLIEANLGISDGALVFTRGDQERIYQSLIDYAAEQDQPCLHIDFDNTEPHQAAFRISVWASTHDIRRLFVTGSWDGGIYHLAYDSLYRALLMGKEKHPEQAEPAVGKKPMPRTVEEAVQILIEELPLKDKVAIANLDADGVADLNLSLGNHIRNEFGLWNGNRSLMESCAGAALREDHLHPDEASAVIIALLALKLKKTHRLRVLYYGN